MINIQGRLLLGTKSFAVFVHKTMVKLYIDDYSNDCDRYQNNSQQINTYDTQ